MGIKIKWRPRPNPIFKVGDWVTLKDNKWVSLDRKKLVAYQITNLGNDMIGTPTAWIGKLAFWVPTTQLRKVTNEDKDIVRM